jgi:mRNA interferase RelE/StbE
LAYEVRLKRTAERLLRKLPREVQVRVARRLDALAHDPRPSGCEKLSGIQNLFRIRVGDYRIVYEIADDVLVVLVITIGHRGDVYRRL